MTQQNQITELLTVDEASKVLRLKPSTVRSWLLNRRVPFVKLGSRVLLRQADLNALIEAGFRPAQTIGGLA